MRVSTTRQLAGFIAKYDPKIAKLTRAVVAKMRKRLPGAVSLVYDNYNALAIGFGGSERVSDAIFSIAVYPRWVTLFFLQGARLTDAEGLLKGSGKQVRHKVLGAASDLDHPGIKALMRQALARASTPIDANGRSRTIVKSVSAKQRPRRPPK